MQQWNYVGDLVIANGATASGVLHNKNLRHAVALMFSTGALTGTVGILVDPDPDADVTPTLPLYIETTAVTVTASKVTVWRGVSGFGSMSALSGSAEGGARTIKVWALLDMHGL